jgi:hypothetical protein
VFSTADFLDIYLQGIRLSAAELGTGTASGFRVVFEFGIEGQFTSSESGDSLLNPHSSAKTGRPLGSEKFIETLESQTGKPLKSQKPGRKPFK